MTDDNGDSPKGYGSVISAIMSAVAFVAVIHPKWKWIVLLSQHAPEFANVLPWLLAGLGAIGGAISHPPAWLRGPWDDVRFWVGSFFRRKAV